MVSVVRGPAGVADPALQGLDLDPAAALAHALVPVRRHVLCRVLDHGRRLKIPRNRIRCIMI